MKYFFSFQVFVFGVVQEPDGDRGQQKFAR